MIPDDMIDKALGMLFGWSSPGDTSHNLLTIAAPRGALNAFGQPDPAALTIDWATIMPVGADGHEAQADDFIGKTIMATGVRYQQDDKTIYFAGLVVEAWSVVERPADKAAQAEAQALLADLRLHEHPDAAEVSRLYAACRDGRRWTGERVLTGPHAGRATGPDTRTGVLTAAERGQHASLIRTLAGIGLFRVRRQPATT